MIKANIAFVVSCVFILLILNRCIDKSQLCFTSPLLGIPLRLKTFKQDKILVTVNRAVWIRNLFLLSPSSRPFSPV